MRSLPLLVLGVLALSTAACLPAMKTVQGNVAARAPKTSFRDLQTRERIPELLVIPLYHRASGTTVDFHAGEGLKFRDSPERPVVHVGAERLLLPQNPTLFLLSPVGLSTKHVSVNGLFLIAPGYRPQLLVPGKVRDRIWSQEFLLPRWPAGADQQGELRRIRELLSKDQIPEHALAPWANRLYWDGPLELRFDEEDRRLVEDYFAGPLGLGPSPAVEAR